MKPSSFFKGLSWLLLLNLLVKPTWILLIDREVQNRVGYEAYGQYFALLNLSYVLFFLTDAGLSTLLNQRMANQVQVPIGQLFRFKIFLFLIYVAACCCIGWLTHISQWNLFFYLLLVQGLTSLFVFLRSMVTAHQYFSEDAVFSVMDKGLMILFCGSILYTGLFGQINLTLFLQIQAGCTALSLVIVTLFIWKKNLWQIAPGIQIKSMLLQVLPFALVILFMSVHYRLDGFLLERINARGAMEAGIYASAYRLLDAGNMVGYLAASFLVPFVARHQFQKEQVEETIIQTRHGLICFSIGLVCFACFFAPWIQRLLYHTSGAYNSRVLLLCVAALPAYYLVHIYGSVLTATLRLRGFLIILVFSVLINLGINILFIPSYGALACCVAALVSQYFCGLMAMLYASRSLNFRLRFSSFLIYPLIAVLLSAYFYFGKMVISNVWVILATAICLGILLLATQLNFIKKYFISTP